MDEVCGDKKVCNRGICIIQDKESKATILIPKDPLQQREDLLVRLVVLLAGKRTSLCYWQDSFHNLVQPPSHLKEYCGMEVLHSLSISPEM
jgi:hypothetical protein